MRRRLVLTGVALAIAAAVGANAWARSPRLERVGGMGNACTCTQRIEP